MIEPSLASAPLGNALLVGTACQPRALDLKAYAHAWSVPVPSAEANPMPAFEVVLRQPNAPDRIRYSNRGEAEIGDLMKIDGGAWMIVEKQPPFELRRIERIICIPRPVPGNTH